MKIINNGFHRVALLLGIALLLLGGMSSASAQSSEETDAAKLTAGKMITLDMEDVPVSAALKALFTQAHIPYKMAVSDDIRDVLDKKGIRLHIRKLSVPAALTEIMRRSEGHRWLKYTVQNGVFVFENGYGEGVLQETVTLRLQNADLISALKRLCDVVQISGAFAGSGTRKITLELNEVPFDTAVQKILDAAAPKQPLAYHAVNAILCVGPKPHQGEPDTLQDYLAQKVTVQLHDEILYYALKAVLGTMRANFTIDEKAKACPNLATLSGDDLPLERVLEKLLGLADGEFKYIYENRILSIVQTEGSSVWIR